MADTVAISTDPWPDLTIDEAKEYVDAQIPYPNLASNEVLARRAVNFVDSVRRKWERDTDSIRQGWRWVDYLFRANALKGYGRDVHCPEILKAHRSIGPRIVEAFMGNGQDWFAAVGVDSEDKSREAAVTSALQGELERNKFREKFVPAVNSLLKYGVTCFKTTYERKSRKQAYHWIVERKIGGKVIEEHHRKFKDVVYREGCSIRLVDPNRLIVDAYRWDLDDLSYIGDFGMHPTDEVISTGRMLGYANIDQLQDRARRKGSGDGYSVDSVQNARTNLDRSGAGESGDLQVSLKGGRDYVELTDMWGWFNFAPDGSVPIMRETVITVADRSICLRLQENFHDDKHRPYAIGRSSENGFEFYDVGLYQPAFRTQDEIDHFRSTVYETADLTIAPRLAVSGPATDLPSSLWEMPPGYIMQNVGSVSWQPTPNTMQFVPWMDSMFRRDIEEIIGAPRIWQGTESAPGQDTTATEVRRKIEEGNRRLLGQISALDRCCVRLLQNIHSELQQFATNKLKFRVLNKEYARLLGGSQYEMKPSELMYGVDFVIYGVRRIQQYGLRGTNMMTFLQIAQPLLERNPGVFDEAAMLVEAYRSIVGEVADDKILLNTGNMQDLEDQHSENTRLRSGRRVSVDPRDNDRQHLDDMRADGMFDLMNDENEEWAVRAATYEHSAKHLRNLERKEAQDAAAQEMNQRTKPIQQQDAGPEANYMAAAATPVPALERGARQTNGVGSPQQVTKPGRSTPIEQSRNGP